MNFKTLILASATSLLLAGTAMAQTSVKIGVLNDRSGV